MDAAQWPQGVGEVKGVEAPRGGLNEKKPRPQKEQALNCPRCNSTNTKFCYYNNYSLTQPRYFCKTCRRYWTEGGSLRNVPVGGGSRKNKRSSSSSSITSSSPSTSLSSKKPIISDLTLPTFSSQNPNKIIHGNNIISGAQDLNLAYPPSSDHQHYSNISNLVALHPHNKPNNNNNSSSTNNNNMDFLKNGINIPSSIGLINSFMPMPHLSDCSTTNIFSSSSSSTGLHNLHDFKPTLNFSLDGFENGYNSLQGVQETTNAKLFFPNLEDLKPVSVSTTTDQFEQDRGQGADLHQSSNGYWSGMLGGGSW